MARNFLGFDQRGMLGFDLGDGGPPAWLPPTPDTTAEAMRLEQQSGRDPAAVLGRRGGIGLAGPVDPAMAAAIPAAPSAMGPTALAQQSQADGRQPSIMWDAPAAPQRPSMILDVAPPATPAPSGGSGLPAIPAGTPIRIESGPGDTSVNRAMGKSQVQIDREQANQQRAAGTPAPAPAGPALAPGDPKKLVPTPNQGVGAPTRPGSPASPTSAASQEYKNWLDAEIAAEARKRPSGGTMIKGGKMQTGEQWQGAVGPNADTLAALQGNAKERARMEKLQADAYAKRDEAVAQIGQEQANYEAKAAEIQAQIAARRQEALDGIGGQVSALQKKIASAEIDDGRWWGSKSASDKALVGIAVALDGLVRGLTGRVGQPNAVLQEVYRQQDRDIDMQIKNVEKQRGDLNDLQRVYVQTKEQFGDEALAADAAKLAGLAGFKAKIQAEAAKADAVQATDPVFQRQQLADMAEMEAAYRQVLGADTPSAQRAAEAKMQKLAAQTRSYSVRARLLELDTDRKMLEQQAAIEERMNGTLAKSFGFTQDRYVGGSAGADPKKIRALLKEKLDTESDQRKLGVTEREAAAKGEKDEKAVFVDGAPIPVGRGASQASVDKSQDMIFFADSGLDSTRSLRVRSKQAGGLAPGDPALKLQANKAASLLANASGAGVPSESQLKLAEEAVTPGPRQDAALTEMEQQFRDSKKRALQRVGAGKLWPVQRRPSRCTTRRRVRLSLWPPTRRAPSSARGAPPSPPTRTFRSSAPMVGSRPSRAARPENSSPPRRASRRAPRASRPSKTSSSRTNSAASAACSARPWRVPLVAPPWACRMSPWPRRAWSTGAPSRGSRRPTPLPPEGVRPWASLVPPWPRAEQGAQLGEPWAPRRASPRRRPGR